MGVECLILVPQFTAQRLDIPFLETPYFNQWPTHLLSVPRGREVIWLCAFYPNIITKTAAPHSCEDNSTQYYQPQCHL